MSEAPLAAPLRSSAGQFPVCRRRPARARASNDRWGAPASSARTGKLVHAPPLHYRARPKVLRVIAPQTNLKKTTPCKVDHCLDGKSTHPLRSGEPSSVSATAATHHSCIRSWVTHDVLTHALRAAVLQHASQQTKPLLLTGP